MLNKYFPPDFDPSKIPRMRKPKDRQEVIRLMAPFSMRCNTCGEYIYAGKKFNGRKETVQGEAYYGIKIFRFYIKCPVCSSEITFKTDPKNSDYTVEHGVSRNFEPWREGKEEDPNADPLAHLVEEEGLQDSDDEDPMKSLERRTQEAKREMEIMDALQDIRTRNARLDRVNADEILQHHLEKGKGRAFEHQRLEDEEDEALVRKYFGKDLSAAKSSRPGRLSAQSKGEAGVDEPQSASGSSRSPSTPEDEAAHTQASGLSVKRARPENEEDDIDKEPDIKSLLSDKARERIQTSVALPSFAPQVDPSSNSSAVASSVAKGTVAKRKKGTSAFGVVRKKA